jgi:hypothetical protein
MPTNRFLGSAPPIAHVRIWAFAGTWETNDITDVVINGKIVFTSAGDTVIANIIDTLIAALNASTIPEFAENTWSRSSNSLVATADVAGRPLGTITVNLYESDHTTPGDAQLVDAGTTSTGADSVANSGPNDYAAAANWSLGAKPVNGDDVLASGHRVDMLYNLNQSGVAPASFKTDQSYGGRIGLPQVNAGGYAEHRPTYLQTATPILTYAGTGSLARFDVGAAVLVATVNNTGSSSEIGLEALLIKGSAMSGVTVNKGSVAVAVLGGETSALTNATTNYITSQAGDAKLRLGEGCTATTTINANGGLLETNQASTTVNNNGCVHTHRGSGGITTYNNKSGKLVNKGSGTIGTYESFTGTLDLSTAASGPTFTNCVLNAGSTLKDPLRTGIYTNKIRLNKCGIEDVTLDLGKNIDLAVTNN